MCDLIAENRPVSCRRVTPSEYAGLEVRSRGLPADHRGDIRLVEIEGVDLNTCGGTHVRATAEIGVVKLLRAEPLRGGCRLYWVAGQRVRSRLGRCQSRSDALRRLFDAGDSDVLEVATKKMNQLTDLNRRVRRLEESVAAAVAKELLSHSELIAEAHFEDLSAASMRQAARIFSEQSNRGLALLTAAVEDQEFFALAAGSKSGIDLMTLGPRVEEILDGRGGGQGGVFQGKAGSLARRDEVLSLMKKELGV